MEVNNQGKNYIIRNNKIKLNMKNENWKFLTPKKSLLDAIASGEIQKYKRLLSPLSNRRGEGSSQDHQHDHEQQKQPDYKNLNIHTNNLHVLKNRYLLSELEDGTGSTTTNNGSSSNTDYLCVDIYTEEEFLCKVVSESYDKIRMAYFRLSTSSKDDSDDFDQEQHYIRPIRDIIPITTDRSYLILPGQHFGNLHSFVREKRRLQESQAKQLFRQICKTVQICHRNGIVLRDLKLRKFYFTNEERTNIQCESLDGVAVLNDTNDDQLYEKIGCPLYVAPELITVNTSYGGKAADMWALGVILYTMVVGQYPFSEINGQTLFSKILSCNYHIPNGLSNNVKCLLKSLLRRCPEERLTSDDVFFHPWFQDTKLDYYNFDDFKNDQYVPEYSLEDDEMFELT